MIDPHRMKNFIWMGQCLFIGFAWLYSTSSFGQSTFPQRLTFANLPEDTVLEVVLDTYLSQDTRIEWVSATDNELSLDFVHLHEVAVRAGNRYFVIPLFADSSTVDYRDLFNLEREIAKFNAVLEAVAMKDRAFTRRHGRELETYKTARLEHRSEVMKYLADDTTYAGLQRRYRQLIDLEVAFSAWSDITRNAYKFCSRTRTACDTLLTDGYLAFLNSPALRADENYRSSAYLRFVKYYSILLGYMQYQTYYSKGFKAPEEILRHTMSVIDEYETGYLGELIKTRSLLGKLRDFTDFPFSTGLLDSIQRGIHDPVLTAAIAEAMSQKKERAIASTVLDTLLAELTADKIIIDVWTEKCAPCLSELVDFFPDLVDRTNAENAAFIFISVDTGQERYDAIRQSLTRENVVHVLLDEHAYDRLRYELQIQAFPYRLTARKTAAGVMGAVVADRRALLEFVGLKD